MSVTLILGGARSGKSRRAEQLASESGKRVVYIATAPMIEGDKEWLQRIEMHRQRRPAHWQCVEETIKIQPHIPKDALDTCVLLDCATLWLSNLIFEKQDVQQATQALCATLEGNRTQVIIVSNELGMGLVPEDRLSRHFRDAQGRLNQQLAAIADHVVFMVAGLPMVLKESST